MDGIFIGNVGNSKEFIKNLKEKRRNDELSPEINVRYDAVFNLISISTEPGRVLRPLIIVEEGVPKLKDEHLVELEQ